MRKKTVLVVLGAGASFDCAGNSASTRTEWQPPLARELFDIAKRPAFEPVLAQFRGVQMLATSLAELSRRTDVSLERELRQYHAHRDVRIRTAVAEVPRYLGALLGKVSENYTSTPGAYVRLVRCLVADTDHEVECVTLNYDSLMEQAISIFDRDYNYESLQDYVHPARSIRLYKVHGSITWFTSMRKQVWQSVGKSASVEYTLPERPWQIEVSTIQGHNDPALLPIITPPLFGKTEADISCPPFHSEALLNRLRNCTKLLIIGTSGMEPHLLGLLAERLPVLDAVHFVGGKDIREVQGRIVKEVPQTSVAVVEASGNGLRAYLDSEMFQRFLRL